MKAALVASGKGVHADANCRRLAFRSAAGKLWKRSIMWFAYLMCQRTLPLPFNADFFTVRVFTPMATSLHRFN